MKGGGEGEEGEEKGRKGRYEDVEREIKRESVCGRECC